jgi:pyocin large subunit-like protein
MVRRRKPYQHTNGYESYEDFIYHYNEHASELDLHSWLDFARWTDLFCGGPKDKDTLECTRRRDGATLRYNHRLNVFGVLRADGYIGTCYCPDPDDGRSYFNEKCKG